MKLSKIIEINECLIQCSIALNQMRESKDKDYDHKTSYGVAKNTNIVRKYIDIFNDENKIRLDAFAEKDENKEYLIKDNKIIFGKNKEESDRIYNELMDREIEIDLYKIPRNECTDKLPPMAMASLLDVIITD